MTQSIHLSLDAMGGDYAPQIVIEGAAQSKIRYPNLKFSFFGNKDRIIPLINSLEILRSSNVIHTDQIIDPNEKPWVLRSNLLAIVACLAISILAFLGP